MQQNMGKDIIQILIDRGANAGIRNYYKQSPRDIWSHIKDIGTVSYYKTVLELQKTVSLPDVIFLEIIEYTDTGPYHWH